MRRACCHHAIETREAETLDGAPDKGDFTRRVPTPFSFTSPSERRPGSRKSLWRRYHQLNASSISPSPHRLITTTERFWQPTSRNCSKGRTAQAEGSVDRDGARIVLPLVVIDSLNMFGTRQLNREEVYRLLTLFRKYQRIGVFVVESSQDTPFDSTIADVVISLSHQKDHGYFVQHFEIEKSRYYNHVNGPHPYKTVSLSPVEGDEGHLARECPTKTLQVRPERALLFFRRFTTSFSEPSRRRMRRGSGKAGLNQTSSTYQPSPISFAPGLARM